MFQPKPLPNRDAITISQVIAMPVDSLVVFQKGLVHTQFGVLSKPVNSNFTVWELEPAIFHAGRYWPARMFGEALDVLDPSQPQAHLRMCEHLKRIASLVLDREVPACVYCAPSPYWEIQLAGDDLDERTAAETKMRDHLGKRVWDSRINVRRYYPEETTDLPKETIDP
jgi:hypothetical protein